MNLLVPHPHPLPLSLPQHLSFSQCPFLQNPIKIIDLVPKPPARASTIIRMGGGPRTYPGGVSKWVWKRMQAKKAKQLLKARLCRERQIYEMRKRAELKAAVSELERPWEVVSREAAAPNLFSVGADEQVKVLADRFQRPGGFDLWSERDGPVLFESPDELPSARFFPKGVVHSIKPYRKVDGYGLLKGGCDEDLDLVKGNDFGGGLSEMGGLLEDVHGSELEDDDGECSSSHVNYEMNGVEGHESDGRLNGNRNGRRFLSSPLNYGRNGVDGDGRLRRSVLSDDDGRSSDGGRSSRLNYGRRNGLSVDGRMRRNDNGSKYVSKGVDRADGGDNSRHSSSSGRNGGSFDGRLRSKRSGRRVLSKDVDRSGDGRLTSKENGRRFMSKDVAGSNGLYSGGVGSVRKQRGGNSIRGRSRGKYSNRTSDYASPRGRDANSEVYDMDLHQDGSYGFLQKREQSDSTSW